MDDLRRDYVEQIRRDGAPMSAALAAAFAAVPREAFVAEGFQRRNGTWARPGDRDFLTAVYTDDVLVTKVDGRIPVSSSSQPSLMAIMLDALDVRPGARVLEIGAGTGYNAALLASLGATVISVDVQEDVAARARTALDRAGISGVRVVHGDGYAGAPGYRFDRVVVTVGVAGLSPQWLAQLEPDGWVIAPVEHAGTHPVLAAHGPADGPVTARVVCPSGFMSAAGPLIAAHPRSHPAPAVAGTLTGFAAAAGPRWKRPLDSLSYRDLWYAAGVWHRRATHAAMPGHEQSCLVLLDDDRTGGAAILADGSVLAGGPDAERFAADAADVLDRWADAGRPAMQAWTVTLERGGRPDAPIWAPAHWTLDR
jgi:protein-L-isoaspartate(D-aspartate) O-methyltransferase